VYTIVYSKNFIGGFVMSGASAEEFKKWREHAAMVGMDSLRYIIKDCAEARES
jgi:hypothetical protein